MAEQPDRQRLRPTVEGRARLLGAIESVGPPHAVDAGTLGEYAELIAVRGQAQADGALPEVAAHLAAGCERCADDLRELMALVAEPDLTPPAPLSPWESGEQAAPGLPLSTAVGRGAGGGASPGPGVGDLLDSGIYAVDLPDPQAAEAEALRRQQLRRLRDGLLIVAATAILLMGLSLVGLAYLSSGQPGPRLDLTPVPAGSWAPPSGMTCPGSHPVKGNRSSMIYHVPGGEFYEPTRPEDCFANPTAAEAAGYRRSQR